MEIAFLSVIIIFFCVSVIFNIDFVALKSEFARQIVYAILTAVLTTVLFTVYSRINRLIKNAKFCGSWIILEFDGLEDYKPTGQYVLISQTKEPLTLEFIQEDSKSLNSKHGIIYINPDNNHFGELIINYEWLNQTKGIYPVNSFKAFYDLNTRLSSGLFPTIKIIDSLGKEKYIMQRSCDQSKYFSQLVNERNEMMFSMATPMEDIVRAKDLN